MTDALYRGVAEGAREPQAASWASRSVWRPPSWRVLSKPAAPVTVPLSDWGIDRTFRSGLFGRGHRVRCRSGRRAEVPSVGVPVCRGRIYSWVWHTPSVYNIHAHVQIPAGDQELTGPGWARLQGIKDTPLEAIQRTALEQPKRFLALEGMLSGSPGLVVLSLNRTTR